ncbi:MAG: GntR family transcriptional regulator [Clostridia bacterium]|nr:GntR family transcriptional regulator [Clostridia bacterium]
MQEGRKSVCINIADRIRRDIEIGVIADGDKLPSCRELALSLGVNPNTVQKAYSLLEQQGFIEVIPQKGAYAHKSPLSQDKESLAEQAVRQIQSLKQSGITLAELQNIVNKVYGEDKND